MPDSPAARIISRLSQLYPEMSQQLQGEEVEALIAEELDRPWTYCHEGLPAEHCWCEVAALLGGAPAAKLARFGPGRIWRSSSGFVLDHLVYAWRPERPFEAQAPPFTPEALAYLEREGPK